MNFMRLFVSYAHIDKVKIGDLVDILRAADFDPWWDDRLKPGDDWKEELKKRIVDSDAFVFVISNDSLGSEWCQWELAQASAIPKPIIPILIRSDVVLPPDLARLQYIDASSGISNLDVARLIGKLASLHQSYTATSVSVDENPNGFPSRFIPSLPRDYRTVTEAYFKPYDNEMYLYNWKEKARSDLPRSNYIVGIDFGTTESSVGVYRVGECKLIPNDFGEYSTPSAVAIADDGTPLIGRRAVDYLFQRPERGVLEVKRLLGSSFEKKNGGSPVLEIDGFAYSPVDFVAFVLQQLREDAESYLQSSVSQAVITAPAYFDHSQYVDLMEAAKLAQLRVLRVLPEPVAACLGVGVDLQSDKFINWLVYDLGGGTFDASVIEFGEGVFEVKAVNGDTRLGGADFDKAIVDYCVQVFKRTTSIDLSNHVSTLMRIRAAAERAKIALSKTMVSAVQVPYVAFVSNVPLHLDVKLTRARYNELTHDLVKQTLELAVESLEDAGYSKNTIDGALVVGLAARAVSVSTAMQDLFGSRLLVAPDHVVALGAAIQGAVLGGHLRDTLLLDSVVHTLRIQLVGGRSTPIVIRNTTIPAREWLTLSTQHDEQDKLLLSILAGESSWADRNEHLKDIEVRLASNDTSSKQEIRVCFDIDANSDLKISIFSFDNVLVTSSMIGLRWDTEVTTTKLREPESRDEVIRPLWKEIAPLPPLNTEIFRNASTLERWICHAACDLVIKLVGPHASGGWWIALNEWLKTHPDERVPLSFTDKTVFEIFSREREILVDTLEQFSSKDLSFLRRCMSIASMVDVFSNHAVK